MRGILPGRPQPKLQAVTHGSWEGIEVIAYITGNAFVVLNHPNNILQTTYIDSEHDLEALSFHEETGKIAVCSKTHIYIYKPYGRDVYEPYGDLKWSLQGTMALPDPEDSITTLSWGMPDEILTGSASLTLFNTHDEMEQIWTKKLANSVKFAQFSPDSEMIASTGTYDRLLKIWRRLTFGSGPQSFDYAYLPHPMAVTGIHWRRPFHKEQQAENVLYTICADNKVRIWVPGEPHADNGLHLWAEVDLMESIKPRSLSQHSQKRYAFFIDGKYFTLATERAVQQATNDEKDQMALHHLVEVANRSPEICVVLDDRGNMSAWGFENIGARTRKTSDVFNIAHVDGLRLHFAKNPSGLHDNVQFYAFCGSAPDSAFTILSHHFDGRVEWLESRIDYLFDLSPQPHRITRKTIWTGHSEAVKKVNRTASGRAFVSRTVDNECHIWVQRNTERGVTLHRHSTVTDTEHIHRTLLLHEGDFVIFLHHDRICLWDSRGPMAQPIVCCPYKLQGKPLCLLSIPETEVGGRIVHIATISSELFGICWELRLPPQQRDPTTGRRISVSVPQTNGHSEITMEQFSTFDLGSGDDLAFVLPVDPAGDAPTISGFLDTFARDVAISYTKSGTIKTWTARVDTEKKVVEWLQTSNVDTSIPNPAIASGTSIRKAALADADRTTLTIWNTRSAQLEYEEKFEGNGVIQDIDWSSTPDGQSILAVGFPHRVAIYAQLRYDYLNAGPSWVKIRDIGIKDMTPHPIGDSVWMGSGNLVICAGNQLFVEDEQVRVSEGLFPSLRVISHKNASVDIFTAVSRLNGPLPVYDPQVLSQCVLAGKLMLAQQICIRLYQRLKFFSEGDELDSWLGFDVESFSDDYEASMASSSRKALHSSFADFSSDDDDIEPTTLTEDLADNLNQLLTTKQIPLLSSREQFHLADIIECIGTVEKHRRSIDANAGRFLLFFRQHALTHEKLDATATEGAAFAAGKGKPLSWREITWAFHSQSQDILVDLVQRHYGGKMLWGHARECGLFMWLNDVNAIKQQFELLARNTFTSPANTDRSPVGCSLYYLALRKKTVLVGLWRMGGSNKEQAATHRLLSNNFQEERWKTAALKNAYALMGRRRFEYAAAFFLLADRLADAVSVLHNQLGDTQLAIAVARVYEGVEGCGLVLAKFLEEKVLPEAVKRGDRWLATWAFWMLGQRDLAVRALVSTLTSLIERLGDGNGGKEDLEVEFKSKSWTADDPALVVLYKQLREKSLQALRGAALVGGKEEWDFVVKTANLYTRMGCDVLALDLVRTWPFLAPQFTPAKKEEARPMSPVIDQSMESSALLEMAEDPEFDPRRLLRRRSSLIVNDLAGREKLDKVREVLNMGRAVGELKKEAREGKDAELKGAGGVDGAGEEGKENLKGDTNDNGDSKGTGDGKEKKEEKKKPPPTQFQEPDANSLLDAFGF